MKMRTLFIESPLFVEAKTTRWQSQYSLKGKLFIFLFFRLSRLFYFLFSFALAEEDCKNHIFSLFFFDSFLCYVLLIYFFSDSFLYLAFFSESYQDFDFYFPFASLHSLFFSFDLFHSFGSYSYDIKGSIDLFFSLSFLFLH